MAKKHKEDNDEDEEEKINTKYDDFKDKYAEFRVYSDALKRVQNGGMVQGLDAILTKEIVINLKDKDDEEKRAVLRETLRNISNPYVTSPLVRGGAKRNLEEFKKFGEDNLEAILRNTPDEELAKSLQYVNPREVKSERYEKIAKLHEEVIRMSQILELVKNPKTDEKLRYNISNEIRDVVAEHYVSEYKDNPELAEFFSALINYQNSDNFALRTYAEMFDKKKKEFEEELKDRSTRIGYLKSALGKDGLFEVYVRLFDDDYKKERGEREEKEERGEEE